MDSKQANDWVKNLVEAPHKAVERARELNDEALDEQTTDAREELKKDWVRIHFQKFGYEDFINKGLNEGVFEDLEDAEREWTAEDDYQQQLRYDQ